MRRRKSQNHLELMDGELYINENDDKNYWNKKISVLEFVSTNKKECLRRVNKCIDDIEENHKRTSESLVDILLNNHQIFINIGKYVERLEKNVTKTVEAKNQYCSIVQNLSKEVCEFSDEYQKVLKNAKIEENIRNIQRNNSIFGVSSGLRRSYLKGQIVHTESNFDEEENHCDKEEEFNIEEFLKPKKGSKNWLKEQSEIIYNLIQEKKINEAAGLIREIKNFNLASISYETKIEIDKVFNYMIEHLNNTLIKAVNTKDILEIIDLLRELGHSQRALNSYLLWISKNLNRGLSKAISFLNDQKYEEDFSQKETTKQDADEALNPTETPASEKAGVSESLIPNIFHLEEDNFEKKFEDEILNSLKLYPDSSPDKDIKTEALGEINKLVFKKRNSEINLIINKNANKIIYLYEFFFDCIEKYLDSLENIFQNNPQNNESRNNKIKHSISTADAASLYSPSKAPSSIKLTTKNTQAKPVIQSHSYFNPNTLFAIIPNWIRSEVNHLAVESEILFLNLTSISELNLILSYIKKAFGYFENKGFSAKFIFDDCFISNFENALKSIFYFTIKNKQESFTIEKHTVAALPGQSNRMDFHCIGEISDLFKKILEFLIFLITLRMQKEENLIHIIFLEEFFFEKILLKNFFTNLAQPLKAVDSYNYSMKAISNKIYLDKNGIPIPNEILINWGISLYEILRVLKNLKKFINENKDHFSVIYVNGILKAAEIFEIIKKDFFGKLFKSRVEIHFFHAFAILKENEVFARLAEAGENKGFCLATGLGYLPEQQKVFYVYFCFLKAMARNFKQKLFMEFGNFYYRKIIKFVFFKSLFENFKSVIISLKDLNAEYNLDFCFKDLNLQGFEAILIGVYFVFNALQIGFDIEIGPKDEKNLDDFVNSLIIEYFECLEGQESIESELKGKKGFYNQNTKDYINKYISVFKDDL